MLKIVKIGGNIVDNPEKLDRFLTDFAALEGDKILVHGGGKVATTICRSLDIETVMIKGRRVTDEQTLRVVTMVYAGLINKTIVGKLQRAGCDALGLCGADGQLIRSVRRAPRPVDYGYVGDPAAVNTEWAGKLLSAGFPLVAAPIPFDPDRGELLNTNADTVASALAVAMAGGQPGKSVPDGACTAGREVELIYCFEKRGVLRDVDDENSVIPRIDRAEYARLQAGGVVADGMLPKLDNAFRAIENGVARVVICSAESISEKGYGGTTLVK